MNLLNLFLIQNQYTISWGELETAIICPVTHHVTIILILLIRKVAECVLDLYSYTESRRRLHYVPDSLSVSRDEDWVHFV